jgi:alpha,alpha-trehalase
MYALIQGLLRHTNATARSDDPTTANQRNFNLAVDLSQRYLDSAYCTWQSTGMIMEKYSDESTNIAGGGGEYEVVPGFGVTVSGEI